MRTYDEILDIAVARKGSVDAVMADLMEVKSADQLAAIPDDRWLAMMARGIFQAGINWKVIENKWPDIEAAFYGFDVARVAHMSEDWFYDLIEDTRIVRSPPKVRAIQENALWILQVAGEHGSFGRRVGDWPVDDFAGLLAGLKTDGARLGGGTGSYLLRYMGKESYIMSGSVVARLVAEGVVDKAPTSKKAWAAVQAAFNQWKDESGENLTTISRVLAYSADG
jgi:3-methyladenine DNA glycosylase Tag